MKNQAESPRSARFPAFHYRHFRLFWAGQVAHNVTSWMQLVATGWLVLELTNSPAYLGFNAAFQAVPILIFALVGGVVADRLDRYRLMVWAQRAHLIPDVTLALLVGTGNVRVEHVFAYSFVNSTINGLSTPARQAYIPNLVPKEALASAIGLNSIVWKGSAVLGPSVAGLVMVAWSIAGNFYLNVAGGLVNLLVLGLIRGSATPPPRAENSPWQGLAEGGRYAWGNRGVRALLLSVATISFLGGSHTLFLPVFARDIFAVGPQGFGLMVTMPALGTIVAGLLLGSTRRSVTPRSFILTAALLGVSLAAFGASPAFWLSLVLLVVVGGAYSGSSSLANTLLQQEVEDRLRGRVMSYFMASTWGAWRAGAVPIGLLASEHGAQLAIGLAGIGLLLVVIPLNMAGRWIQTQAEPAIVRPASEPVLERRWPA